jgi:putative hydrolase of the HAD superfamily
MGGKESTAAEREMELSTQHFLLSTSIKAVVFDFGNVVGFFDYRRATRRLVEYCGMPESVLRAFLFSGWLEDEYESGRMSTADFLREVRLEFRPRCSDAELAAIYADIFWPNADVCALVPRLKPCFRLVLGSNTSELHSRRFRGQFAETLEHFDAQVLSHEIGVRKPNAGFYEHCRRLAGFGAGECLFIDDLPANVAGARGCGWHAIVYTGIDDLNRDLAALGIS